MDQISASKMNYQPIQTTTGDTVYVEPSVAKGLNGAKLTPDMLSALGLDKNGNGIKDMITSEDYSKLPPGVDLAKLQKVLEDFISGAKDRTALFSALIEMMNQQRQSAVDQRANARESAKNELLDAAGKSKEAANKQMDAAIAGLVLGIISGATQIATGGTTLGAQAQHSNKMNGVTNEAVINSAAAKLQNNTQAIGSFGGAAKDMTSSAGQGASGTMQSDASNLQAQGQEKQAVAQDTQGQQDIEKKFAEDLTEAIKAVIQFIKEIRNAEIERMASITRA
jgi:Sec-independent protein translocase protein TatA